MNKIQKDYAWETIMNRITIQFSEAETTPTSEAGVRFPARPEVGKLVVACRWSAVCSTEP